jgi:hypothetical protein
MASVAEIDGLTISSGPAFVGLLDTYTGAAAGYSTRRLATSATNLMRIREDSGDTETDIGYDSNGNLDTAAIATHCGTANGFVVTWYDQSGNANDADQSTLASQPQIYDGTAVITDNGKSALSFDGGNYFTATLASALSQPNTISAVALSESGEIRSTLSDGYLNRNLINYANASGLLQIYAGSALTGSDQRGSQHNLFALFNGSSSYCYVDGSQDISGNAGTQSLGTRVDIGAGGAQPTPTNPLHGNMQEWICWNSNEDTNRSAIEGNQNAHYQIGNFGTPTSGLLATYTGAAAAYSVRQLANTAALSMRVREDATDTETDIGFDANGDLDTAAIAAHCGSANGYVVNWYDQAGSQNDATQSTSGSQPQIYNGTAVLTENGKPAVDFDGTNHLVYSSTTSLGTTHAFSIVGNPETIQTETFVHFGGTAKGFASFFQSSKWNFFYRGVSNYLSSNNATTGQQLQIGNTSSGTYHLLHVDGVEQINTTPGTMVTPTESVNMGAYDTNLSLLIGNVQEVIWWDSDQRSNRTGIETDINTYFSIY